MDGQTGGTGLIVKEVMTNFLKPDCGLVSAQCGCWYPPQRTHWLALRQQPRSPGATEALQGC